MELTELCDRLDDRLRTDAYTEIDASANGLQIGPSEKEIEHAAFAVDAAHATITVAGDLNIDLLVVHHGLFWGGEQRITGRTYERIAALIESDVALYASHLPLDGHPELGNAAGIADRLDLRACEPFGTVGEEPIGQRGELPTPLDPDALAETLGTLENDRVKTLPFGPDTIESVAIVTGNGTDWIDEAAVTGADLLITGEAKGKAYHAAREAGIHVFCAGHYATETFGVRSLQELIGSWECETEFISHPTGL